MKQKTVKVEFGETQLSHWEVYQTKQTTNEYMGQHSSWGGFAIRKLRQPPVLSINQPAVRKFELQGGLVLNKIQSFSQIIRINQTYDMIDLDQKGYISVKDLQAYASKHNYPKEYSQHFITEASNYAKEVGNTEITRVSQQGFVSFVQSRETALKAVFNKIDRDGDGVINVEDLLLGLKHVKIRCPTSRCTYKCDTKCIINTLPSIHCKSRRVTSDEFRRIFFLLPRDGMMVQYWLSTRCGSYCDVGQCVVFHDAKADGAPWGHLVAGAVAGAASRTTTAPMETLRLMKITGAVPQSMPLMQAAGNVMTKLGWKGLYKGNLANVIKSAPQKAIDFFMFDSYKRLLQKNEKIPRSIATFTAAGLAGATSLVVLYPLEVLRCKLSSDTVGQYKGFKHVYKAVVAKGGRSALYAGIVPSVLGIIPEAAITYGLFDHLKSKVSQMTGKPNPGVVPNLLCGVVSAFTGQLVAYPLETVSRQMQVQGSQGPGPVRTALYLVNQGGPSALYRGLGATSVRVICMAAVSFGTYEAVRWAMQYASEQTDQQRLCADLDMGKHCPDKLLVRKGRLVSKC